MTEELAITPAPETTPEAVVSTPSEEIKQDDAPTEKVETVELTEAEKIKAAMQKRIDRLTAKHSKAEKELEELRKLQQTVQGKKDGAPKPEDFETQEDYLISKGKFEAMQDYEKAENDRKKSEQEKAYQQKVSEKRANFDKLEAELRKTTPDYDEATKVFNEYLSDADPNTTGFQVFRDILMESPNMPALAYHLGKNPDILEKLPKMSVIEMARTLFVEEYKLLNAPKASPKQPLPEPPKPLGGSSKTSKSLEQMSPDELREWRRT